MNQNTTIETIREAIGRITALINHDSKYECGRGTVGQLQDARTLLCKLANRLEAAPLKEQPPVEQSEGLINVLASRKSYGEGHMEGSDFWRGYVDAMRIAIGDVKHTFAPAAVIEPEPELDEFEQWLSQVWCKEYRLGVNAAIAKYREIRSRKGDK